ncbi:MAG: hypothetical protein Q8N99_07520 [Nanoarchaeota archaeon]|nr:hypothetical protein [Nanoarchaeota archaeon]
MEIKIKMISAASNALTYYRGNPMAIDEETFQFISDYIEGERIRDEKMKIAMIASAGKALKIAKQNPNMNDKQILKQLMDEIPELLYNLDIK